MKQNKTVIIISLIWEILRYIFLFLFTVSFFLIKINESGQAVFWLLAVSSPSLLMSLILIVIVNKYSPVMIRVFIIGKILQIFPLFMLLVSEFFGTGLTFNYFIRELISRNFILVFSFIFIDLLFLSLLLSYNIKGDYNIKNKKDTDNLPDIKDIQVSDVTAYENKEET
jgi:hypothetical protein